jgi:AraC-like DNA-binding protein
VPRDARELGGAWTSSQQHEFPDPAPDLAGVVDHHWAVSWDYPVPYRQLVVPYPNVHLTFEGGAATVHGVSSGHQQKLLTGRGRVVGVAFRAGRFRPFLRAPVAGLTDRSVDAREVFGPDLPDALDVQSVEDWLRARLPDRDPAAEEAGDIVGEIIRRPATTRVEELALDLGTSTRRLQRLFAEHVGVGPKRVIRRYRLHEVTQRLAAGTAVDWAGLAAQLGYADQGHFVRDFTAMFGESPTRYAARY